MPVVIEKDAGAAEAVRSDAAALAETLFDFEAVILGCALPDALPDH